MVNTLALKACRGDWPNELGFAVRENGSSLSCVAITWQLTGDPLTQYMVVGIGDAVASLGMGDKVSVTGRLISPSRSELNHLRRASPFFVVTSVVRL